MSTEAGRRVGRIRLAAMDGATLAGAADRTAPRYRTFLAGKIRLDDGDFVLCVVRDMSKSGARLVVDPAAKLSEKVELHVLSRDEIFHGEIVWREDDLAGMQFTAWKKL
jgi:hypothetical protein